MKLLVALAILSAPLASPPTVAERTDYKATATPTQVLSFLRSLAADERCQYGELGRSVEGRPIGYVRLGQGPVVLLLGGIHAGECAGKEAILALIRDELQRPTPRWIHAIQLVAIPDFNVDGNARRGRHHRPHQLGPAHGMGLRHNAQRLNLNRDFVKLETPEVRHLVRFLNANPPLLFIDTHTTNGAEHDHDLLFDIPHHPAVPQALTQFLKTKLIPAVSTQLTSAGFSTNYYGTLANDGRHWRTFGFGGRYSTEYLGLRGAFALLSEAYSRKPYRRRIQATRAFLETVLDFTVAHLDQMRQIQQATARPKTHSVPVAGKLAPEGTITLALRRNGQTTTRQLEYWGKVEPTHVVQRPWAYAIPATESRLLDRLRMHGIPLQELQRPASVPAIRFRVSEIHRAAERYQGHRTVRVSVERERFQAKLPRGTVIVPTEHTLGTLTVTLLDPEAHDSLLTWNFLDHHLRVGGVLPVLALPKRPDVTLAPLRRVRPMERLTLERIFGPERRTPFSGRFPPTIQWLPDGRHYLVRTDRGWIRIDAISGAEKPAYDGAALRKAWAQQPAMDSQEARRLARRGWDVLGPHGRFGIISLDNDLYLIDLRRGTVRRLTHDQAQEELVTFSPTGRQIAYVKEYNLFVYDLDQHVERQLTRDGDEVHRFGKLDWVYQEEIYGRGNYRGYWWSPDGAHLAFIYLDETGVRRYPIVDHIPVRGRLEQEFYPKAGDPLPKVALGIVPARGGEVRWVDLDSLLPGDRLVVRVGFTPDSKRLWFQLQNRQQTWLKLVLARLDGSIEQTVLHETSPAWVEVLGEPLWLDHQHFLWLSDRSGHRHLYRVTISGDTQPVTSGPWDVLDVYAVSEDGRYAFLRGTKDSPIAPQIYRVDLRSGKLTRLSRGSGAQRARFAPGARFYVGYESDVFTPPSAWLYDSSGRRRWAVEPNLVDHHRYLRRGPIRFFTVPARDGFPLECMAIFPPDFRPGRQYPVLCYVYGGPQAPVVQRRWAGSRMLWFHSLAQQGILVWVCDNRASSLKGIRHTYSIYRRMGEVELRDLLDSLEWLKKQGWVQPDRVAIHGWSYGGYMSAYAALHSSAFRVAIAGAPVTDWRNYDAIYTERYMGMPQENPAGYAATSLPRAADRLAGRLVLIHGLLDDNVHPANTFQLVHALQGAGKAFDLMVYPKARHGVGDPKRVRHLYEFMTRILMEELKGRECGRDLVKGETTTSR